MQYYYFLCLFRADKSASGLAFRVPILWRGLNKSSNEFKLIINKSLYDKVLSSDFDVRKSKDIIVVPEWFGFKLSLIIFVPLILLYIFSVKKIKGMHVSVGGLYFLKTIRILSVINSKYIPIHTSIGSKSLEMATGGDINGRYYNLHYEAMKEVDRIDCLYSPEGFPEFSYKMIQSPGSFSWKYSSLQLKYYKSSASIKERAILFCGSIIPQKNFKVAFDAYKNYCELNDNDGLATFYLVSPHIPASISNEIIDFNRGSAGKIVVSSYSNIDLLLEKSYIFLSLQDYDNYPSQSLIEAMSFGCTVIATNSGETSRLVKVENGNFLINKDYSQLSLCLGEIFSNEPFVNYKNINHILSCHSIEAYVDFFKNKLLG